MGFDDNGESNVRQFRVILGDLGGPNPRKRNNSINKKTEACTPNKCVFEKLTLGLPGLLLVFAQFKSKCKCKSKCTKYQRNSQRDREGHALHSLPNLTLWQFPECKCNFELQ